MKEWNARSNPRWFGRANGWTPERLPHRGTDSWRVGDVVASPAYTVTPVLQRWMPPTSWKFSSKTAEPMLRKFFTAMSALRRETEVRSVMPPPHLADVMTPCTWWQ
jgi:hypothetical protein